MQRFISGVVCGGGMATIGYIFSNKLESPTTYSSNSEIVPHVVMNEPSALVIPSEVECPQTCLGLTLTLGNVLLWLLFGAGKILFSKNEIREKRVEETKKVETTKLKNFTEGKIEANETESTLIKNLYYLGPNCNHSKLDEKIQKILNTNKLGKIVKMRQIAFDPTRSLNKPTNELANGADILLIDSDHHLFKDLPHITINGFGEYEISTKAKELLNKSVCI